MGCERSLEALPDHARSLFALGDACVVPPNGRHGGVATLHFIRPRDQIEDGSADSYVAVVPVAAGVAEGRAGG